MTHVLSRPLPHRADRPFLTDGGLETWLIFHKGIALRAFAAFELIENADGRAVLREYFEPFLQTAAAAGMGFVLDTPTWRASPDWGRELGYDRDRLAALHRAAVDFLVALRAAQPNAVDVLINGVIGPRGDGYDAGHIMSVPEAEAYHRFQIDQFAHSRADMVSAITMTNVSEAVGIVRAAREADIPAVISFTVETDGRLPSGQPLGAAIEEVDRRTMAAPAYYMVNCAHPDHFSDMLQPGAPWLGRIRGVRANASRQSHAELDAAESLDAGDPVELGTLYGRLARALPGLAVAGGCCGTDHRHVQQMCAVLRDA
ncbi:MAG: homocysteine S-methyltransferase family protein [Pseudomonadota bacterium]